MNFSSLGLLLAASSAASSVSSSGSGTAVMDEPTDTTSVSVISGGKPFVEVNWGVFTSSILGILLGIAILIIIVKEVQIHKLKKAAGKDASRK
jgi:hypothetical protein